MVLGLLSNTAAIYAIVNLKIQKKNHTMKLILFLFTLDMGVCLIAMPLHMTTLIIDHTCAIVSMVEFCAQTFGHLSAYTTGIIGYDRYLRMRYLNDYPRIVKPWKIYTAVSITILLSFAHGAAYALGVIFGCFKTISAIGTVIDCFVFLFMVVPYVLLLTIIRKYRKIYSNQEMLNSIDHSINKIALRIIIAVVCLYAPYVIITLARQSPAMDIAMQKHQSICVILLMCYHLIYANSFVNSLIFLSVNSACKAEFKNLFKRCPRSSTKRTMTTIRGDTNIEFTDMKKPFQISDQ